jgi:putative spermidine/putrescine transport system ATP-binding protein
MASRAPAAALALGTPVVACIRPENLRLAAQGDGLAATVEIGMPLGATIVHELRTASGARLKLAEPRSPGTLARPVGAAVWVKPVSAASVTVFAAP